ncbi:MAG: DUF5683 domain-containing protein [Crocinitomicaceae bacterium]
MRILVLIFLFQQLSFAQIISEPDSSVLEFHQKSMLYSAIIPGAGQIRNSIVSTRHNNAIWKVPIIYAGVGSAGYFLISNQRMQKELKFEYAQRQIGGTLDPKYALYDDAAVLQLYRQYLDWRDLSILGLAAVYFIQIAEAGAEAHFVNFDTSPDLSFHLDPFFSTQGYVGARLSLSFH